MLQGLWLAAVAASALVAGSTVALSQTPKKGGILHYALTTEPPNYDCHGNTNYGVSQGVFPHYSRLLRDAGDWKESKIVGDVAEGWDVSPDGLAFTFRLRKGVQFHDGSLLTSADVRATYERLIKPPPGVLSARQALYQDISSIETPDDHTIIFR